LRFHLRRCLGQHDAEAVARRYRRRRVQPVVRCRRATSDTDALATLKAPRDAVAAAAVADNRSVVATSLVRTVTRGTVLVPRYDQDRPCPCTTIPGSDILARLRSTALSLALARVRAVQQCRDDADAHDGADRRRSDHDAVA
jgi:hypothetical protein